ncbi:MAG: right-handed parallel beta-helix repeat-containing protein [Bacteroidales bacterium]|nr:right-handed parallel beta-helix repeat-containing protein [Bacteroidales bacterium]
MANIQICFAIGSLQKNKKGQIIRIPADFPSITQAVTHARDGDFILLAPGNYNENEISIDKRIVISSEWKQDGDASKIENTIIDAGDKILFNIQSDGVEISGLKIINGDHPLNIESNVIIAHNHFVNNKDAISFEGSGGGYAGYNTIENDRDDGIDLDIRKGGKHQGTDITVEYNTIFNSNDDGIEIRLYDYPGQNIRYTIRNNTISGSINAGIQLISYDIFTAKEFHIHHNIIKECKVGLGCMDGTNTREDLEGASTLDEKIYFYNNTLTGNQLGATGGNSVYALNNVVKNNILGGFKRFGKNSAIVNNLFYQNGNNDFQEVNEQVIQHSNRFGEWPLLCEKTFAPLADSPCIDAGKKQLNINGKRVLKISGKAFLGNKPDLGAVEYN